MVDSYLTGKDLYSTMAASTFTLLADRTVKELNDKLTKHDLDIEDPLHGSDPIRQQLYKDEFIFYDGSKFAYKKLTSEDCYDGTLYRKSMKTIMLGMNYGMSEYGLAKRLKISEEDARGIINDFFRAFPKLSICMKELKKFCMREGYIETDWGRKRRIPDIWHENKWIRKKAERQLFNSKIQGGAADMLKIAMLLVAYDPRLKDLSFRMLLTVHDELIGSAPRHNAFEAAKIMISDMVGCAQLRVPLKVDAEIYLDGQWNGDSAQVKVKDNIWTLIYEGNKVSPESLDLV